MVDATKYSERSCGSSWYGHTDSLINKHYSRKSRNNYADQSARYVARNTYTTSAIEHMAKNGIDVADAKPIGRDEFGDVNAFRLDNQSAEN